MTNLKKLSALFITASFAVSGVALAGAEAFTAADINADGSIDKDEFLVFVSVNADNGDVENTKVRDTGDYDKAFAKLDTNADGKLSRAEAAPEVMEDNPVMKDPKWEEPELKDPYGK
ncbi:MAG: EF-hand domain-containing protein [Acidimicrobiales bacterium]|nr:EF-hand domain-containing protein [Hyphomonadaceae bacterium]RZV44459.1 MAG: EF-hand domain-containing protein [Acidimicrobiales bacterium]